MGRFSGWGLVRL